MNTHLPLRLYHIFETLMSQDDLLPQVPRVEVDSGVRRGENFILLNDIHDRPL